MSQRPHQGIAASGGAYMSTDIWSNWGSYQNKIARIYMPQRKHLHCHPADKTIGKYWAVDFATQSTYKSPLMQWTSASSDAFYSKGDNIQMRFPTVESAIDQCEAMGFGWEVSYPKFKYHTYKNYATNFTYKGEPKPEADYD